MVELAPIIISRLTNISTKLNSFVLAHMKLFSGFNSTVKLLAFKVFYNVLERFVDTDTYIYDAKKMFKSA